MWAEFTNSLISQELHKGSILVGSRDFVIQELRVTYPVTVIDERRFVVKFKYN
jgi:hypothetical protein